MVAAKRGKFVKGQVKAIDESAIVRCAVGIGELREEVWIDASGKEVRYNLAFINHHLYAADNGRVLGYDTAHGSLHRHYAGNIKMIEPAPYCEIFDRFLEEVQALKQRKTL